MAEFISPATAEKSRTNAESSGTTASGKHALPLADHREEAAIQRRLQEKINASPFIRQLKTYPAPTDGPVQRQQTTSGLPGQLQSGIEQLSGLSMQDVSVHYNSPEPATVQAHAFAQGRDIHLAPGQEQHLPHEAWHVVQQQQGRVRPTMQLKEKVAINDDAGLEREADVMGEKASQLSIQPGNPEHQQPLAGVTQRVVQRVPADFADHPVLRLPAKTGLFRTSYWEPLRNAVLAYSTADIADVKKCRRLLREMAVFADRWKVARNLAETATEDLDDEEIAKVEALEELEISLRLEYFQLGSSSGNLQNSVSPGLDNLENEPELTTTRTEKDGRKRGYFIANSPVTDVNNADLQQVAAGTVCRVIESTEAVGGAIAKSYYKVRPAPDDDRTYGTVAAFPEGYIRKDLIHTVNLEKDASGKLHYEDRFSEVQHPLFQGQPSVEDVEQSSLGDCYLQAAIMAIVRQTPQFFVNNMVDHGDGVVSVRLHEKNGGGYQPKIVHVRKSIVVKSSAKTTLEEGYNKGAIWVQLIEKAYIMAGFTGGTNENLPSLRKSWTQLEGGSANYAFAHLTGNAGVIHNFQSVHHLEFLTDSNWAGIAGNDLEGELFHIGPPARTVFYTFQNLRILLGTALVNLKGTKDEIRLQDAQHAIHQVPGMTQALETAMVNYMRTNRIYPDKRGKGLYTDEQLRTFTQIITAVRAHSKIVASTHSHMKRGVNNFFGRSGNESVNNGLAGPHAYEVIDFSAHGITPLVGVNPTPDRICWVKLRNPWGEKGRLYKDTQTGLDMDQTNFLPVAGKMEDREGEAAEFWMPLEDFAKRFHRIIVL